MGWRREKWIAEGLWHVRAGKDHQGPKSSRKYHKLFKQYQQGFEKYVCQSIWYVPLHCKQSCKA